jgi:electron transfer flavoprotein-quinone oxidoreductase
MSDDIVKMDAIVVGGGPAGIAAAYTMAQAGLEVIVVERGEYSGSKNMGGLLYGTVLNEMIPEFYKDAPIERPVSKRRITYLGATRHAGLEFGADEWSQPPFNNTFIVWRSQFDRWFAKAAEEAGVNLLEGMVVEGLIYEGEGAARKAVGVKIRGDEQFYADAIIVADGANCLVKDEAVEQLGMAKGKVKQEFALGIKEVVSLPQQTIEDRFGLSENEGAALDFFGAPFDGLIGGAFIYTAKDALHVGLAVNLESLEESGRTPNEIMEGFKTHPLIEKHLKGGELSEYAAHLIPEGGYDAIGQLSANGVLIVGDAAGLVNASIYKEGTNHAMESGKLAGETVIAAKQKGDFSRATLGLYEEKLRTGVAMQDMRKFSKVPHVMHNSPNLFSLYPEKAVEMMCEFFTVSPEPKKTVQKRAMRNFLKGIPKGRMIRDVARARKLV